jgi:3-methyl-2-oxobutanoate hydroxymethyltransferase
MTGTRKVRVPDLAAMKVRGEWIVMLTAYDFTMARLFDRAGMDVLLVRDSLGQVILGLDSTICMTLDAILHHTRCVARGAERALVVADMPFLTYQVYLPKSPGSFRTALVPCGSSKPEWLAGRR